MQTRNTKLIIFSDLDGSLLDHETYRWDAAQPWLTRLANEGIPLIITTSKTAAEVEPLRRALGLEPYPYIAENGAIAVLPTTWQSHPDYPRKRIGAGYSVIRTQLESLRASGFRFKGFGDMSCTEIAEMTGLAAQDAQRAQQREATEPLLWLDEQNALLCFCQLLAEAGLALTQGGRFYHVMSAQTSKGFMVNWIKTQYVEKYGTDVKTLGLGDGPNDISLLCTVDYAVLIKGKVNQIVNLPESYGGEQYCTQNSGPQGWSEGLDHFIGNEYFSARHSRKRVWGA
ncbi:mannosyl-3-phosphoglycerate phosphatase-related protein [Pectobacterium brasiliense]|uniref:Mannosyl-3-phosphoglycerate phosphatase-related protein n=1 Tax=Pectobacterium brasiliense TaxID=180957 RepID=A0A3S1FHD1_9GAMM|nr:MULTISPECIES: mannosyl-3-phosphoglycerate phosphatase-related protein [Pectobacterium]GKW27505.1 mannosyl-3-phosphoglycerate phosphatase [Pectobacterium carotovorum subsp. carotovorum]MBN3048982.1 mannosyl-3-phosphoglycerate phosphatase-related protein [Pectobacterium brasiliense]MBN3077291.1 mannosyl-3-phosphoglycerate phosphatase-related protein [Pectobacterium brasiliense]MBN3085033.1 mannosyl-3-phosphoglycerate phosphatase-related protein [Pectobacterium brasiliense]MBN3090856.1 mannosy